MNIITASNDNYAQHLGVMLTSLLENLDKKTNPNIFIMDGNISSKNKFKLQKVVGRFNLKAEFISIDDNFINSFKNRKIRHISKEAYYRIIIPDLLSRDTTKALYLDCDLLVKEDISKLWNINIDNYFLAAVEVLKDIFIKKRTIALSIPEENGYFNSGVLLVNLKKWRENNTSTQVIQYIKDNPKKVKVMDQDGLNAILYDKWLKLDPKWNYLTKNRNKIHIENPAIIHFTGPDKPWNSDHPFKQEYLKYLRSSLWKQES